MTTDKDPDYIIVGAGSAGCVLAARLSEHHPYEVPELLALAPEQALAPYLAWVQAQAKPTE